MWAHRAKVSLHQNKSIDIDGNTFKTSPSVGNEGSKAQLISLDTFSSDVNAKLTKAPKPEAKSPNNEYIVQRATYYTYSTTQQPLMEIDEYIEQDQSADEPRVGSNEKSSSDITSAMDWSAENINGT